jgi:hypothetical protein
MDNPNKNNPTPNPLQVPSGALHRFIFYGTYWAAGTEVSGVRP